MTTINNQDDFLEALRNNPAWREAVRAQILGDELLQLPVKFDAFVEEHRTTHINIDARLDRIEGDTGALKGDFARTRTVRDAAGIASDMGLQFVRTLSSEGTERHGEETPCPGTLGRSFRNADLVIEATDRNRHPLHSNGGLLHGGPAGTATGPSGTPGLITRFTGKPAQAAVASVRNDREATEAVESGSGVLAPAGGPDAES